MSFFGLASLAAGLVILSDVPTPALVIDTDAVTSSRRLDLLVASALDDEFEADLGHAAYLHSRVRTVQRQRELYTKDASYALASLDVPLPAGGAYLSMGLNNDYDASYYWARHAGFNCRRAVPGIDLRPGEGGYAEIFRLTEEEARAQGRVQPNDGKWSEVGGEPSRSRPRPGTPCHAAAQPVVRPAPRRPAELANPATRSGASFSRRATRSTLCPPRRSRRSVRPAASSTASLALGGPSGPSRRWWESGCGEAPSGGG